MKLKLLMDTFWHQEVRESVGCMYTCGHLVAVHIASKTVYFLHTVYQYKSTCIHTQVLINCNIQYINWLIKTEAHRKFHRFKSEFETDLKICALVYKSDYPRRQSSIACSSCNSWHWGPQWRQRRCLTLAMTARAGPLAPLGEEKEKEELLFLLESKSLNSRTY